MPMRTTLFSDLLADAVFLLVQRLLFLLGDMAAILAGHGAFFVANLMIFRVQLGSLALGNFALFDFTMDAAILVRKAAG